MAEPRDLRHGAARVEEGLRGKVRVHPRFEVEALPIRGLFGDEHVSVMGVIDLERLAASVVIPVKVTSPGCAVEQMTTDGWKRVVQVDTIEPPSFFPPILVSARDAWRRSAKGFEVFDKAIVVDGASRLEIAARLGDPEEVPLVVMFGLEETDELFLREDALEGEVTRRSDEPRRVGAATQRLEIGEEWVRVRIESDPFVVPTWRGYAPAILVRRPGAVQGEHVLIGARSLGKPLEELRVSYETLCGLEVQIRKEGSSKTALYRVELYE